MDALIDRANATPLTGPAVRALAASASAAEIRETILPALRARGPHAATVLAFALTATGERLAPAMLLELLPDLPNIDHLAALVGSSDGDRVGLLLDLVEGARASWEREAMALYLATQLLDQTPPPPMLVARLRTLARRPLGPEAALIVSLAARALDDAGLKSLAMPLLPEEFAGFEQLAEKLRAPLFAPALDTLSDREPTREVAGYTVVRTAPKTGRNDPCPCGSGRKYKKCCEAKGPAPGHQSIVEQFEALSERHAQVREQLFDFLRPADLARIDPERLTTLQLIGGMRKLVQHRRWELAERFLDRVKLRPDVPGGPEHAHEYHSDIADEALAAGELALAERHYEQARLDRSEWEGIRVQLALARHDPQALACIEAQLLRSLRDDDPVGVIDCAHSLLDYVPALGIAVARGCVSAERPFDTEMLLEKIEDARDRLGLDVHEPWWEVYDQLAARPDEPRPSHDPKDQRERQRLAEEVEQLRRQLHNATRDKNRLDEDLQKRIRALDHLTAERDRLAAQHGEERQVGHEARVAELAQERQRLRAKIEELKGEIAAGAAQRSDLRRELARLADTRSAPAPTAPARTAEPALDDEEAGEAAAAARRSILVPHYDAAAAKSLALLPRPAATQALHAIAALAAGEARTWSNIKRMRATEDVYSLRIGRNYRVLFRVGDQRLEVADITDRKDLDAAVNRAARS